MENRKIILIFIELTNKGIVWHEHNCNIEEKKSIYVITRKFEYDGTIITKYIKKDELFKIIVPAINSTRQIMYKTYCYPEDVEETKELLLERVKKTVLNYKTEIDDLIKYL